MKDLLVHTSKVKVDILEPKKISDDRPCICFSLNQFISHFGQYVYLFIKEDLEKNFYVNRISSKGLECYSKLPYEMEIRYRSKDLGEEYRIYKPIDTQQYCIGILTDFNYMEGRLEKKLREITINEMISLDKV